jgi:glycosyltransferase involved in cell wall biosynthesis
MRPALPEPVYPRCWLGIGGGRCVAVPRHEGNGTMNAPRVSIGLPVYNGERYLAAAVDALLAQTFTDFELIVSDNASTDATASICADYAARDRRIRHSRNAVNIGGAANYRRVFHLATGRYFMWAAHDDLHAPTFVERCAEVLDRDPTIVVCHTRVCVVDSDGAEISRHESPLQHVGSPHPHLRFGDLVSFEYDCWEVLGLIRADVLRSTPLIASFIAADCPLRAELGLRGRFHEVPEYLFYSRDHAERATRAQPQFHQRGEWFDPALAGKRVFPYWRLFAEYARSVRRVPLSRRERLLCYWALTRWLRVPRNLKRLAADIPIAAHPSVWELFVRWRAARERRVS